jgi:hypothetical protein
LIRWAARGGDDGNALAGGVAPAALAVSDVDCALFTGIVNGAIGAEISGGHWINRWDR